MILLQFLVLPTPPDERPDDLVDAAYVARRFACSTRSVYAGKCGTGGITPVSRDPWRAVRSQVEKQLNVLVELAVQKRPGQRTIKLLKRGEKKQVA